MLPAKHTAGLASCKYLIVLHCTVKCAQLRVCIVAVKYGIWLHWKRCIVCVWGRQKVFHNCLWQATGHRPWSFGRLDFHCFKCQAYGDFFLQPDWRPSRLIWTTVAKKRSFELVPWNGPSSLYLQCHATTLRNWYQISLLRLISSLQVRKDCNITLSRAIAPRKRIASQYYTVDHACSLQCLRRSEVWNPCTMQVSSQQRHCSFSISSYHAPLCKLLALVSRFKCL